MEADFLMLEPTLSSIYAHVASSTVSFKVIMPGVNVQSPVG